MPLVVKCKGEVVFVQPKERPQIGRMVIVNDHYNAQKRRDETEKLSLSMSLIQKAYLFKGK
jgi:hypothetical protein